MTADTGELLVICYACIQGTITLLVGVLALRVVLKNARGKATPVSNKSIAWVWSKTTWKMRKVYGSLTVHIFDFLTDLLVIREWFLADSGSGQDINPTAMAITAIGVLVLHRTVSCLAIFVMTNYDWRQATLQFFDLLLFVEIYEAHQKLVENIIFPSEAKSVMNVVEYESARGKKKSKLKLNSAAVESSMRFKYLRSLEAVFEAVPQSVLQLVWVMRRGEGSLIFSVSILQSIYSMTNCMVNGDNTYMVDPKWKKYKQRFPIPSFYFIRHFMFRVSEISYRVGLLSIFWTVVGGPAVVGLLCFEFGFIIFLNCYKYFDPDSVASWYEFFLSINTIVALPPDFIFELDKTGPEHDLLYIIISKILGWLEDLNWFACLLLIVPMLPVLMLLCHLWLLVQVIRLLPSHPWGSIHYHRYPAARLFGSFLEWTVIIIVYATDSYEYSSQLVDPEHCLYFFIASLTFFVLYFVFYPVLMPDIRLPDNIPIRSKLGYAYLANLSELEKLYRVFSRKIDLEKICQDYFNSKVADFKKGVGEVQTKIDVLEQKINSLPKDGLLQLRQQLQTLCKQLIPEVTLMDGGILSLQEIDYVVNQCLRKLRITAIRNKVRLIKSSVHGDSGFAFIELDNAKVSFQMPANKLKRLIRDFEAGVADLKAVGPQQKVKAVGQIVVKVLVVYFGMFQVFENQRELTALHKEYRKFERVTLVTEDSVGEQDIDAVLVNHADFWDQCIYYAQKNNKQHVVDWLEKKGAKQKDE